MDGGGDGYRRQVAEGSMSLNTSWGDHDDRSAKGAKYIEMTIDMMASTRATSIREMYRTSNGLASPLPAVPIHRGVAGPVSCRVSKTLWTTSDEQGHRVGGLGHGEAGPSSVGLEESPTPQRQDGSDQPHLQLRWLRREQALTTRSTSRLSNNLDALSF